MRISDTAIDNRTTVYVLLLVITVCGLYAYVSLPRESSPEVIVPFVVVSIPYEGVAPSDIETLITIPIERELTGISGVKKIESISMEGISTTEIEFEPDIDIDDALQKVRDKIDQAAGELPDEAEDPIIQEINIGEFPIMYVNITGNIGLPALSEMADDLEDELEAIRGVLDVEVVGDVEREIQIEVDPDRVAEYGVPLAGLVVLTQVENVNTPGGALELGEAKYVMRVPGEFQSPDELTGLVVKRGETGVVYLRDIAEVRDGFKEVTSKSRLDGHDSVTLTVSKRAGENIIDIAENVKKVVAQWNEHAPAGVTIEVTMDQSTEIIDMVRELENSILSGLILVLVVIFVFMGFGNALMVALAIPISMLITFFALYMMDVTLNMVVLFSLILALGMLVDNGIVVVENIYRHTQAGIGPVRAAKQGASEVAWPIIGSTLTTVAAFTPMFFWPGVWGSFMVYLPMTVCIALGASLFVGLVVNPAIAAVAMRRHAARAAAGDVRVRRHLILRIYARILRAALRWRLVTVTIAVMVLLVIGTIFFTSARVEFVPETDPLQAYIDIDCPEGTNLNTTDEFVRTVEAVAERYRENIDYVVAYSGSRGVNEIGGNSASGQTTHLGRVTLDFRKLSETTVSTRSIVRELRGSFSNVTGAEIRVDEPSMGPPSDPPVNVELSGEDFDTLARLAREVREAIKDVPGLVDLRDDYDKGKPEVRVVVDRERALLLDLNTQFIGLAVKAAIDGRKAADYREGDEEYDVMVRFPESFRADISNVESMTLTNERGEAIPFSAVARLEQGAGLGSITRVNRKRTVTVSAEVEGRTPPEVLRDVQEVLKDFQLPPGYTVSYTGENEDQQETEAFLGRAFVAALLLIGLVLVAQFNSVLQPGIIMTSVILSLAGVFLGLKLHDMAFGILMSGIGCISLAGVVVNNAIVLIDFINQRHREGADVTEAIVEAGVTRFRPVMLTAVTTVLGLIPMAAGISFDFRSMEWTFGGESSQWWGPMAIAVIYGLSLATVLTLVVVPVLYSIIASVERVVKGGVSTEAREADATPT